MRHRNAFYGEPVVPVSLESSSSSLSNTSWLSDDYPSFFIRNSY